MRSFLLIALFAGGSGCRGVEPAWSRAPGRALGDDTIAGPPAAIPRFATPPKLDGKLDDAVWAGAATLGPFVDTFSGELPQKHPISSFARAGWDDQNLYLGFVVRDRAPSSPFGADDVDPHVWGKSSGVEIMLQPGDPGDNRDYYEIQVDVGRAVFDSHWDDYMTPLAGDGPKQDFRPHGLVEPGGARHRRRGRPFLVGGARAALVVADAGPGGDSAQAR